MKLIVVCPLLLFYKTTKNVRENQAKDGFIQAKVFTRFFR
jgi:hypothetical protein